MTPMLETQLTVDDYGEYQRIFNTSRPMGRASVKRARVLFVSVASVAGATFVFSAWLGFPESLFFVPLAVALGVWSWFRVPRSAIKVARKLALRKHLSGVFPPTRVWLDELGLNTESAGVLVHYTWAAISEIDETPTHAFVWYSDNQAVILPRRNAELQVQTLVEALRAATGQAKALQPPPPPSSGHERRARAALRRTHGAHDPAAGDRQRQDLG